MLGVALAALLAWLAPRLGGGSHPPGPTAGAAPRAPAPRSAPGAERRAPAPELPEDGLGPQAPLGGGRARPGGSAPGTVDGVGAAEPASPTQRGERGPPDARDDIGFVSQRSLREHFAKHGAEFGKISRDEYLARAKALRDAPLSAQVIERVRDDGVITRFDRSLGAFLAFHRDLTIRTFFRPDDGEAYFERQAER